MPSQMLGTLARWNQDRGFGFIAPDGGGGDVFVHASDMARIGGAPQIGWRLDFQLRPGKDGRPRAFDVQREGMPLLRPPSHGSRPAPLPVRPTRVATRAGRRVRSPVPALLVVAVLGAGSYVFQRGAPSQSVDSGSPMPLTASQDSGEAASSFICDGRTRCSQMTSCAEATYFVQHCPNTEMDGDHDGMPCEQQWCN